MPKTSHIVLRVEPEFRQRLERVAVLRRRELSDISRLYLEDAIAAEENNLGLVLRETPPRYGKPPKKKP